MLVHPGEMEDVRSKVYETWRRLYAGVLIWIHPETDRPPGKDSSCILTQARKSSTFKPKAEQDTRENTVHRQS